MPIYRPGKDAAFKTMPAKDPDAVSKPYTVLLRGNVPGDTTSDPATFLPADVSIVAATVAIAGDDELDVANVTVADTYVIVWLTGGTVDATAVVTVHIVTDLDNGTGTFYEDEISFSLPIKQR